MNRIIFSKYSNERARRFALRTDIVEDENRKKYVHKKAMYPEGNDHIANISKWHHQLGQRYEGTGIVMNRCSEDDEGIVLQYLEGVTLEHMLDFYLMEGNLTQLVDVLFDYLAEVKKGFTVNGFCMSPEFGEVFGPADLPEDLLCADVADIDMVLNNVLVNQGWTLIDYEWTFAFPIPYHFVVYRILVYYLNGSTTRNCLHELDLMGQAGLTQREITEYEKMERHFQEVYVVSEGAEGERHVPIRDLYADISPGMLDLTGLAFDDRSERASRVVQLYQADSMSFSEERCVSKDPYKSGVFLDTFPIDPGVSYVRLDPCSRYCTVNNLQMQWGDTSIARYQMNGIAMEDGSFFFPMDDPQIIIERPAGAVGDFKAYFEVEYMSMEEAFEKLQQIQSRQRRELQQTSEELRRKDELIQNMENTKVWKAYRKYKRSFSGEGR